MATTNDITGDTLISKPSSNRFRDNFDKIFGTKEIPLGEHQKRKDRVKLGLSPSCVVVELDASTLEVK